MPLAKIILIGNIGNDPETRYTPTGTRVLSFSMAVNRFRTGQDGQRLKETDWFRISAFGRLAELDQYLQKGKEIYVEGRFSSRQFQGQDGQMRTSLEVTADNIVLLSGRGPEAGGEPGYSAGASQAPSPRPVPGPRPVPPDEPGEIDDLPF